MFLFYVYRQMMHRFNEFFVFFYRSCSSSKFQQMAGTIAITTQELKRAFLLTIPILTLPFPTHRERAEIDKQGRAALNNFASSCNSSAGLRF